MNEEQLIKELEPKDIKFKVDKFENLILQDMSRFDEDTRIKLNRNLTNLFNEWLMEKLEAKELAKINIKGEVRCSLKGTPLLMANFEEKRIEECNIGDKVLTYNEVTKSYENKEVLDVWDNGLREVFKVKLRGGRSIKCTSNHPLYSISETKSICGENIRKDKKIIEYKPYTKIFSNPEWVKLEKLKVGDYIATPTKFHKGELTGIELNELELIGFYLGDGYSRNNNSLNSRTCEFDLTKIDKLNYLKLLVNNTRLNYSLNFRSHRTNAFKCTFNKKYIITHSKVRDDFTNLIYQLNLIGHTAKTKFIPSIIKLGTENELYSLLSGLFNSDGHIDKTKGLCYNTTSKRLISDIKIILSKLGINYSENTKRTFRHKKKCISYEIYIRRVSDMRIINSKCNLTPNHKQKLITCIKSKNPKFANRKFNIEKDNLNFYKIKSIKSLGKKPTFNLTIKDNNNYMANLIFSKNSGKSLIALKILNTITKYYPEKGFNVDVQVCANQKEYRQRVATAEFGDSFLVDENAFARVGIGSMSEVQQLKDVLNITAKKNLHTIFITPRTFLDTGATMGLSYYGKDTKNWLSRFLLYSLKNNMPTLLGFVIFDVGQLFKDTGCYVYKYTGGCTNPRRQTFKNLEELYNGALIKFSKCIPKNNKGKIIGSDKIDNSKQNCPFYNICKSQMNAYELRKDLWIEKELKGGLDERELERYETAFKLFKLFGTYDEKTGGIRLSAKNGKELKLKVKMKLPTISSTKYTGTEIDEIMTLLTSLTNFDFLNDVCKQLDKDYEKIVKGMTTINNQSTDTNIQDGKNTSIPKK